MIKNRYYFELALNIENYKKLLNYNTKKCHYLMCYDKNGGFYSSVKDNRIIAYRSINYSKARNASLIFKGKIISLQNDKISISGSFTLPMRILFYLITLVIPIVFFGNILLFETDVNVLALIPAIVLLIIWEGFLLLARYLWIRYTEKQNIELIKMLQFDDDIQNYQETRRTYKREPTLTNLCEGQRSNPETTVE